MPSGPLARWVTLGGTAGARRSRTWGELLLLVGGLGGRNLGSTFLLLKRQGGRFSVWLDPSERRALITLPSAPCSAP